MTELRVELYEQHVGTLIGERDRFDFEVAPSAIDQYSLASPILSFAVPLTSSPRPELVDRRRNFFEEILAEGVARRSLAANARLDESNTMGLLRRYGRDVAGAVQVWDPSDPVEPRIPSFEPITAARVREIFAEVRTAPIGNISVRRMSSLAGVQDKIVLARVDGQWAEPLDGYPSTHILKPVVPRYPTLIFDEEYGSRIARHLGLASFDTHLETFDGVTALVIQRYDRVAGRRIHQEDFNQILGLRGDEKYEKGGRPSLASIAQVLRENIGTEAVESLLRMTTMSVAVGNLDLHAKNVSVLHLPDEQVRLAPAYDVVPQMHLPLDPDFAFAINGRFAHSDITHEDLVAEGQSWGVRRARMIVDDAIQKVSEFVADERPAAGAHHALVTDIIGFTRNLMDGRGASADSAAAAPRPLRGSEGGWGGPIRP